VDDFQDLLRLLDEHPDWRAELRLRLLPEELLRLPALVQRGADQLVTLTARVEELAAAQARTDERLGLLTERVGKLTERVDKLTERVDKLADVVGQLVNQVAIQATELGTLKGDMLELRYRDRAPAYFGSLARRLRVLDTGTVADRLDDALDDGRLDQQERDAILLADLVLTGRRREDQADVFLLAEISFGIGPHDVERAKERAALLRKLGLPVLPIVAGREITAEATMLAKEQGVWAVLDGHVVAAPR
jgi:hypothetical protein